MIYLIHGQNQVDSRRFLVRLKSNYQNIESISGKHLAGEDLKRTLPKFSHSLFGDKSALLIEGFKGEWQIIPKKLPEGLDIILWAEDKIDLGNVKVKNFLFHAVTKANGFKLADAILFKREKEALMLAAELISTKEPNEKIIGALRRGFYLVYCAKEDTLTGTQLATFAQKKFKDQSKLWSKTALKKALIYLLWSDVALKEGAKADLVFTSFVSRVAAT